MSVILRKLHFYTLFTPFTPLDECSLKNLHSVYKQFGISTDGGYTKALVLSVAFYSSQT